MANPKGTPGNLKPFQRGETGNPGGKPAGARNRLQGGFLNALADDFEEHGKAAIQSARVADPMGYVRTVASLMPKQFEIERPLEGLSDDELAGAIAELRARLARAAGAGGGANKTGVGKPTAGVQTLQ